MEQTSILKDRKVSQDDSTGSDWEESLTGRTNSTHKDSGGKKVKVTKDIINMFIGMEVKMEEGLKSSVFSMKEEAGLLDRKSTV